MGERYCQQAVLAKSFLSRLFLFHDIVVSASTTVFTIGASPNLYVALIEFCILGCRQAGCLVTVAKLASIVPSTMAIL
jgi:hypothetical protein